MTRMGRPPLDEKEESVSVTFRVPPNLLDKSKERAEALGFDKLSEFVRYCIQQELFKKVSDLLIKTNELKAENIDLRAQLKSRKKRNKQVSDEQKDNLKGG